MKLSFRWYGKSDPIPLEYIRQIPGMRSIVTAVYDVKPGEVWPEESLAGLKKDCEDNGLLFDVVESIPVHEDIKLGRGDVERLLEVYCENIRRCAKYGVKCVTYNFMPVFDWTRTDLAKPRPDGSTVLAYDQAVIDRITDPQAFADQIQQGAGEFEMAGWEPERMAELKRLFAQYRNVSHEDLFRNLKYFLEAVIPVCEQYDVKMAIHPDDPPWDIFGLPRLLVDAESIDRFLSMVDDPYNCLTLCTGSLNANPNNNCAEIVRKHCDRIAFGHIRNIHHFPNGDFSEAAHRDCCGETGIIEVLRAYHDCGFEGYIRPDHGRQLWEEGPGNCRPGYGKYDRALGVQYMLGVWDLLDRLDEEKKKG